jgi:hypothetical protein
VFPVLPDIGHGRLLDGVEIPVSDIVARRACVYVMHHVVTSILVANARYWNPCLGYGPE